MRTFAAKLTNYYCRRIPFRNAQPGNFSTYNCRSIAVRNLQRRNFSTYEGRDELSLEQDAEKKIGWLLKLIFAGTATCIAYNIMPYMVKDPLFKRMGASRLAQFAVDDDRRMKIVEMGGAQELVNMLGNAKDDHTRKEALKALSALSPSDNAIGALYQVGAVSVIRSIPNSLEHTEIEKYKVGLLRRFQDLRYDDIPSAHVSRP